MKRDLNLVRQILLDLERGKTTDEVGWPKLDLPDRTEAEISYHVRLMHADGLIDAHNVTTHNRPPGEQAWKATASAWKATALTSKGHEFIEMARDESLWRAVLAKVAIAADTVELSVLAEHLRDFGNKKLGLPRSRRH